MTTGKERARVMARSSVFSGLADGVEPDRVTDPVAWAGKVIVLAEGPRAGTEWDVSETPYLAEILQLLRPDDPCTSIAVRKSAQVGFTIVAVVWLGYVIDVCPTKMMAVFPTIELAEEFNSEKLDPIIEESAALSRKVLPPRSRSSKGSTMKRKRFRGGSLSLAGRNSSKSLRMKTVKYLFCDEIDDWEKDLAGQGDPMKMADARQKAFHESGDYKKLEGSTPTIKGESRIDEAFEKGDRRFWMVRCPHCDGEQRLVFKNLKFEKTYPHRARYQCEHCGVLIEHHHKRRMVVNGRWVATKPGPGRPPSFHIDALSSLLTTWDEIAKEFVDAKDDPKKLKVFVNTTLGEAWEERGNAPDHERLLALREEYEFRTIPPGAVVVTCGADVQLAGIYYEAVAWGPGKTSWSVDIGFLPGNTTDPADPVWKALDELRGRKYPDAYGNARGIDAFGIDGRYSTTNVCTWAVRWPRHDTLVVMGDEGWYKPAISAPSKAARGEKRIGSVRPWHVGTYDLKSALYENLRKKGLREEAPADPPGYCHFATWHTEDFFLQLTAEYVAREETGLGYPKVVWKKRSGRENHFLDCRVYATAVAEMVSFNDRLGISRFTDDDWRALAAIRAVPPAKVQEDLFDRMGIAAPPPPPPTTTEAPATAPKAEKQEEARGDWIRETDNLRY